MNTILNKKFLVTAIMLLGSSKTKCVISPITGVDDGQGPMAQYTDVGGPVGGSTTDPQLRLITTTLNALSTQVAQIAEQVNQLATAAAENKAKEDAFKKALMEGKNPMQAVGLPIQGQ